MKDGNPRTWPITSTRRSQQYDSAKLGMWIFLMTEVLFFGGLFCAYAVFRAIHPDVFFDGHRFLDKPLGAANTAVLILSSLTMALAVRGRNSAGAGALRTAGGHDPMRAGVPRREGRGVQAQMGSSDGARAGRIAYWFSAKDGPEPRKSSARTKATSGSIWPRPASRI